MHQNLKNDRELKIKRLFERNNLGVVPNSPFSDEVALNLINRVQSRLKDLDNDLDDKKVNLYCLTNEVIKLV